MSSEWYENNFGDLEKDAPSSQKVGARRFWLPKNKNATVMFVSGLPFKFFEHQVKIGTDYRNWFTCLRGIDPQGCPICDYGNVHKDEKGRPLYGRYLVGMFTIIDRTEWKDNDGKVHKDEPKILPVKLQMLKKLKIHADRRGGSLAGCEYLVSRTNSPTAANIGDDWEFHSLVDLTQFNVTPFDFKEIFKPMDHASLVEVMKSSHSPNTVDEGVMEGDEDDIPF